MNLPFLSFCVGVLLGNRAIIWDKYQAELLDYRVQNNSL